MRALLPCDRRAEMALPIRSSRLSWPAVLRSLRGVVSALFALSLLSAPLAAAAKEKESSPGPARMEELWVEPKDLASRDLFLGVGGRSLLPSSEIDYRFRKLDDKGHSVGYEVEDPQGNRWKVKVGDEAQAEIVVSRILWAIGYHQPVLHYLRTWKMSGGPTATPAPGRFRLESDHDKKGDWSWTKNPFAGTRELHGLLVANLVLANWDLDKDNNRVYRPLAKGASPDRWYVVQDVGGALGKSAFPIGTRNKIDDFESEELISKIVNGRPKFDYHSYHQLYEDVGAEDVIWACHLLARLSDRQLEDAFRAADYSPELAARYISKIKQKIAQGLALETGRGKTP